MLDVRKPDSFVHDKTPLMFQYQLRGVSASVDGAQYAVGSTEGRLAVEWLDDDKREPFSFNCHRMNALAFSVNCIAHNAKYGSLLRAEVMDMFPSGMVMRGNELRSMLGIPLVLLVFSMTRNRKCSQWPFRTRLKRGRRTTLRKRCMSERLMMPTLSLEKLSRGTTSPM